MRWRWDQGRLEYFRFENIVSIARVLASLDGIPLNGTADLLRQPLMAQTGLPFAPSHYKVWRNYARVFSCSMLAINIAGHLVVTDLCRQLARTPSGLTSDQYLDFVFSRFALPYPAFDNYDERMLPVYPFVAIAKLTIANGDRGVSLEDVFSRIIGNACTGMEELSHYSRLNATKRIPEGDEERQVREMLVFMGQSSCFKWINRRLYADTSEVTSIIRALSPSRIDVRHKSPEEEFLAMSNIGGARELKRLEVKLNSSVSQGRVFIEGRREFVTHGKLERSPLLRKFYFKERSELVCDACQMKPREKYPWTDNILELHHLLPLSSTVNVNGTTTTFDDLVPLCPSCHRSIHDFYVLKLGEWGVADFGSKKMARDVYELAKREIA